MIRHSMFAVAVAVLAVSAAACDKASDAESKAEKAQAQADEKIRAAQAEADRKVAEQQAKFTKMREDYRHATVEKLITLDKKIADLEARVQTTSGKTRANIEATLKQIHAARDRFNADFNALEAASANTWDDAKARLDKELADMQSLVNNS
jgi:hypothetical protein